MSDQRYVVLWKKYRPVIVQLMMGSEQNSQTYQLFEHEFKSLSPKEKSFTFSFQAFRGRAIRGANSSKPGGDLLYILNLSGKAATLMEQSHYQFSLDKDFVFHVERVNELSQAS